MWAALAFSDKVVKMLGSTIEQMPLVTAAPAALVLLVLFYWLFRIYKGRAIQRRAVEGSGMVTESEVYL